LALLVMDPMALPLSCPCVRGHAQRRYEKLGAFLEQQLDRPVSVFFSSDLSAFLRAGAAPRIDLVIGKRSVVQFDAKINALAVRPVLALTGEDGETTLTGLIVVRNGDPARRLADLTGYTILFGPPDCDEKFKAAAEALHGAGVALPAKMETRPGCSDSVLEMLENPKKPMAAVISSYAASLLEGCGTIEKGSIRVIGRTRPVPFVTVFFTTALDDAIGKRIRQVLLAAKEHPDLLTALETKSGFVPLSDSAPGAGEKRGAVETKAKAGAETSWPGWRGPNRDGTATRLPARLPGKLKIIWSRDLTGRGLAGLAAACNRVIVADRNAADDHDLFLCLDAGTGKELWKLEYATAGKIKDYGNSPRATPLIHQQKVYTLGGLGDVSCVRLDDGEIVWSRQLARDFGAAVPTWGYCASPLVVDEKLIVNPGAKEASLVALDCASGRELWRSPGLPSAYASFIAGRFGGVPQIVGYDEKSLGGWDPATGNRIWTLVPPVRGDFNVPTPIDADGRLIVASENNGTRLYDFNADGRIQVAPAAVIRDLAPVSSTPVLVGGKLFGQWHSLYCLDAHAALKTAWTGEDDAFEDYASIIASTERVLVATNHGELLLVDATSGTFRIASRLRVFPEDSEVLSHPALLGERIYLRDMSKIVCVDISED
jgi:outer membrane protein assembly factor BamB/ABC-type phosphate/phosphonate transport system substrate-binding protein